MPSRPQRTSQAQPDTANENRKTVIRVKRGALRRYDQLTKKSDGLPVDVKWDRRTTERRSEDASTTGERRKTSE